jgi:AcrR family transcriptional regulator
MPKLGMEDIRKEQVIKAAKSCIVNQGISNLSMKKLAEEAGVSTGIIYHYFKNKEDVLLQVLKESFRRSHEKVLETVNPIKNPADKLTRHLENINAVPRDNSDFYVVLLNFLGEATYNQEIRKIVAKFFKNLKVYIEQYMETERYDKNLPVMIYALGMGLGIMWTVDQHLFDIDEMEKSIKKLFLGYMNEEKET